jgi:hypothetical protein
MQPATAEMRLVANLTVDPSGGAGVVFAWKDTANHIVFWLDALRGSRRLERTENSGTTTLWQDAVALAAGHPYLVTIDSADGRLTIHVDGVPLVALDLVVQSGSVGFAVHNSGALTALRVAEPQWVCWRGFGEEETRPAGTRLSVASEGHLHIDDGAALRVVGPDNVTQHTRTFLADSAYIPLAPRVLRKADGTAFFLIPPQGTPQGGSMRLAFTYYRARPEAGRPMSQAGDRTPEHATIDFG